MNVIDRRMKSMLIKSELHYKTIFNQITVSAVLMFTLQLGFHYVQIKTFRPGKTERRVK